MKFSGFSKLFAPIWPRPQANKERRSTQRTTRQPRAGVDAQASALSSGLGREVSAQAASVRVSPAPLTSAFAHLPFEVGAHVLSFLDEPFGPAEWIYAPRLVSRAFYAASLLGQPELNDEVALCALKRVLRRQGPVDVADLSPMVLALLARMRDFSLGGVNLQNDPTKRNLLHTILSNRTTPLRHLHLHDLQGIEDLPEGLHVQSLSLPRSSFVRLPDSLVVDGGLFLEGARLTHLPAGMTHFGGNVHLNYSRVATLPENARVRGSLLTLGPAFTAFPRGLVVDGDLIARSGGPALPDDAKVHGRVDFLNF